MVEPSDHPDNTTPGIGNLLRQVSVAGLFLTRLPFRLKGDLKTSELAAAVWSFPLIGLLVGVVSGGALMGAAELNLHPLACAFIALIVSALVTGALHEDGLADLADGFGGGRTRADKLRIMRDSHIGTYGVLALVFSVGLRTSLLAGLLGPGMAAATLVGAAVLSRSFLPGLMYVMPRARVDGLAASAGRPKATRAVVALVLGCLICWPFLGTWVAPVALIMALLSTLVMAFIAHRQIGGYTGDVLGGTQHIVEITILVTAGAYAI